MERWWEIEIRGRYLGQPKRIKTALKDTDATSAVLRAVRDEFDLPSVDDVDSLQVTVNGREVVLFHLATNNFVTEHRDYNEMATEITNPARIARLEGAPELPLGLDDEKPATPQEQQ